MSVEAISAESAGRAGSLRVRSPIPNLRLSVTCTLTAEVDRPKDNSADTLERRRGGLPQAAVQQEERHLRGPASDLVPGAGEHHVPRRDPRRARHTDPDRADRLLGTAAAGSGDTGDGNG